MMNNIYVDELPKDCSYCSKLYFNSADTYSCSLLREVIGANYSDCIGCKHKDCPLKSLSDLLAEERKKVVQEIGQQLGLIIDGQKQICCDGDMTADKTIMAVLDQIERGEDV